MRAGRLLLAVAVGGESESVDGGVVSKQRTGSGRSVVSSDGRDARRVSSSCENVGDNGVSAGVATLMADGGPCAAAASARRAALTAASNVSAEEGRLLQALSVGGESGSGDGAVVS